MVQDQRKRWVHIIPKLNQEKACILYHPTLKSVAAHSHLFFELTYILSGTVEHTIDGRTCSLSAGDYFLVDYGSIHSYRAPEAGTFSNLDCLFLPELVDPSLKGRESLYDVFEHYLLNLNMQALLQNPAQMVFHDSDGSILHLLKLMQEEEEKKKAGYTEMIRCYLIQVLLLTIRRLENASVAAGTKTVSAFVCAYIAKHYMDPISLTELSAQLNYSLSYVSRCFKEETGMSFLEYLQNFRIKQAARLLLSTRQVLPEIAEQVGYRDVKFFSALFKKLTGASPAAFRRMHRES